MKLTFRAACSSTDDLKHHRLVRRGEASGDVKRNLITLCGSCHAKLRERWRTAATGAAAAAERLRPARPKSWRAGAPPRLVAAAGRRAR